MNRIKYPRTFHLPFTEAAASDDKTITVDEMLAMFEGQEVVVTEKMDGENTTLYPDGTCHARSLDSGPHPSRTWIRRIAAEVGHNIPEGFRVCGENLYARHSIGYDALSTFFMVFGIYDDQNTCLSWDDTVEYAQLLGLTTVPVLYRGIWDEKAIRAAWAGRSTFGGEGEGYVVRLARAFHYDHFNESVAKFVRAGHVQTDQHWAHAAIVPNGLKSA